MISVVIPTHNRSDALAQTLEHLSQQLFSEKWEIIVVNNNCTDDTDDVVKKHQKFFPVRLALIYEKIPGASAARNAGVKTAQGEYIIFIDNDILGKPDLLQKHYDALKNNPQSWIVGQVVNLPEQEKSLFGKYRKKLFPLVSESSQPFEINGITGQNVSMPRQDFEKIGGFDEDFHVASGEDYELLMRGRKQLGIKALLVPSIMVVHNDWAGWTFEDFCQRQRIYAQTDFLFWEKVGNEHPRLQMVLEGLPINYKSDSFELVIRKIRKRILGADAIQNILLKTSEILEKIPAAQSLLWQIYKLRLAGAINLGLREGRRDRRLRN